MSAFTNRLFSSNVYLEAVAGAIGETGANLKDAWAERAKLINDTSSGGWNPLRHDVEFPA
jgi:hypothetical protein